MYFFPKIYIYFSNSATFQTVSFGFLFLFFLHLILTTKYTHVFTVTFNFILRYSYFIHLLSSYYTVTLK